MSRLDDSGKVIDLALYRAMRAAKPRAPSQRRYVLWYPGLGYFRPRHRTSPRGTASRPA